MYVFSWRISLDSSTQGLLSMCMVITTSTVRTWSSRVPRRQLTLSTTVVFTNQICNHLNIPQISKRKTFHEPDCDLGYDHHHDHDRGFDMTVAAWQIQHHCHPHQPRARQERQGQQKITEPWMRHPTESNRRLHKPP
jgi:hypothetical protein